MLRFAFVLLVTNAANSAELESRVTPFEGTTIHYQTSGKGEEALIFVHGWTCNAGLLARTNLGVSRHARDRR